MKIIYLQERSFWSSASFAHAHGLEQDEADACIATMLAKGMVTAKNGEDDDSDNKHADAGTVQVVFVGLVAISDKTIVAYPKYFTHVPNASEMKTVLRALRKSTSTKLYDVMDPDEDAIQQSSATLMLAILDVYERNGVYFNTQRVLRDSGGGNISWERTIAMRQPYIKNDQPIYLEYKTIESARDISDFVTRLHRCVVTECSVRLEESGFGELLGLDEVELSDEEYNDFGDIDGVLHKLESERSVQFVTWKQEIIDQLIMYVRGDGLHMGDSEVLAFGTTSFHHIWEDACKVAFGDVSNVRLGSLGIQLQGAFVRLADNTMLDIIPRPQWCRQGGGELIKCGSVATLIPDVIALMGGQNDDKTFCIYDAKYYCPSLGDSVRGVPGVGDVTKQMLYQSAYEDFIRIHDFSRVLNIFLVPGEGTEFLKMGEVAFPGVMPKVEPPLSDVVEMWILPASIIFDAYVKDKNLDINLNLFQKLDNGNVFTIESRMPEMRGVEQLDITYLKAGR